MVGRSRAWWVAGGALAGGGLVWAVLRFGVPVFLTDENHPARPTLEALSWIAGIGGLAVAVVALVVAMRQKPDSTAMHRMDTPAESHTPSGDGAIERGATFVEAEKNSGLAASESVTVVSGTANASAAAVSRSARSGVTRTWGRHRTLTGRTGLRAPRPRNHTRSPHAPGHLTDRLRTHRPWRCRRQDRRTRLQRRLLGCCRDRCSRSCHQAERCARSG